MNKHILNYVRTAVLVAMAGMLSACDTDDPDRVPPAGQGSIFVNNNTSADLRVFIDGTEVREVEAFDDRYYDLDPGLHRIVLDEQGGDRTYRDDVDVIEGRITVIDVADEPFDDDEFDIAVFFRTP
jgi:hypothetical protein